MKRSFIKFLHNNYTVDDANCLIEHLQNGKDISVDDDVSAEIWEEASSIDCGDKEQLYREASLLLKKIAAKPVRHFWNNAMLWKVAAMIVVVCGSIAFYWYGNNEKEDVIFYAETTTGFGQIKKINLSDGTVVTLNSCSKLRYPRKFENNERKIELTGEAYMQVAHLENSSFTVMTNKLDIRVLGTVFNVKAYPDDNISSVSVDKGKVQVDMPDMMMRLVARENISVNNQTKEVSKIKAENNTKSNEWMRGLFVFRNTDIYDVARELERTYDCHIVFSKDKFKNCITGEMEKSNLDDVLKTICYISGIKYKKENSSIYLYK